MSGCNAGCEMCKVCAESCDREEAWDLIREWAKSHPISMEERALFEKCARDLESDGDYAPERRVHEHFGPCGIDLACYRCGANAGEPCKASGHTEP